MDIDLDQARRRAKELLRAARAGDAQLRDDRAPRLADAQHAVARDLGFPSWPALVGHVEASSGDREERRARLVRAALGGRADVAERLLAHDPSLARAGFDVALVLGDAAAVAAALDADPELIGRDVPGPGRKPLSCACHSVFLRPSSPRAPDVRRTVELLLDRGADVNEVHHNEYGAMSVLYGAAGVAHDLETDAAAARPRRQPRRRRVGLPRRRGRGHGVPGAAARARRHGARHERARQRDRRSRQGAGAARARRPAPVGPRAAGRAPPRRRAPRSPSC